MKRVKSGLFLLLFEFLDSFSKSGVNLWKDLGPSVFRPNSALTRHVALRRSRHLLCSASLIVRSGGTGMPANAVITCPHHHPRHIPAQSQPVSLAGFTPLRPWMESGSWRGSKLKLGPNDLEAPSQPKIHTSHLKELTVCRKTEPAEGRDPESYAKRWTNKKAGR